MKYLESKFSVGPSANVPKETFPKRLNDIWANAEQRWLLETSPGRYSLWMLEDGTVELREDNREEVG